MTTKLIPAAQLALFTKNENGTDSEPVELMPTNENGTGALVLYRSNGTSKKTGKGFDYFTVGKAYFARQYGAWGFGQWPNSTMGVVPYAQRNQFMLAMVMQAIEYGVIDSAVTPNGMTLGAARKPGKGKAKVTSQAVTNGHARPVQQVHVAPTTPPAGLPPVPPKARSRRAVSEPPFDGGTVQAAVVKAPRKRK